MNYVQLNREVGRRGGALWVTSLTDSYAQILSPWLHYKVEPNPGLVEILIRSSEILSMRTVSNIEFHRFNYSCWYTHFSGVRSICDVILILEAGGHGTDFVQWSNEKGTTLLADRNALGRILPEAKLSE